MDNCGYCALTDQDRLEDMITGEKYLMGAYSSFIPETTCGQLKGVLTDNFNGCVQDQTQIFDKMNQLGWYSVKNAPQSEVDAARQKYQQLRRQISVEENRN